MIKIRIATITSTFISIFLVFISSADAALNLTNAFTNSDVSSPFGGLVAGAHYTTSANALTIAGAIISVVLSALGVTFIILMVYGGYTWMIARGEEQKVTKAKDTLTAAVIGLIIIIAAYAISYFVTNALVSPFMKKEQTSTLVTQPIPNPNPNPQDDAVPQWQEKAAENPEDNQ
jgi:hypothetical protein